MTKGIVLAGGSGSRLWPMTLSVSKQILPVYDKPMIYYPISILMLAGIRDILIISTPRDLPMIKNLMSDGSNLGVNFSYIEQPSPDGIAQAFILGKEFIGDDNVCLVLGDNIFYGHDLSHTLKKACENKVGAAVFAYHVSDPERYGVVEFDENGKALSIVEKPKKPKSRWAVTGLYVYDNNVVEIAKSLTPSARGELEITDINQRYLEQGKLDVHKMCRGTAWLDSGTPDSLIDAANFVHAVEHRQGLKIACLEEIAYSEGFINRAKFEEVSNLYSKNNGYGDYLRNLLLLEDMDG